MIQSFLYLCSILGIPVALEKMEWADTLIVFLGILLDGESRTLSILLEKQEKALRLLNNLAEKKHIQIKEIQTLTGYLNFLTKVIFTGRTFTCRMYTKYANLQDAKSGNKLKPHYHIRVDGEFRLDCEIWRIFLTHHRVRAVCRPMVDLDATTSAKQLKFFLGCQCKPETWHGGHLQ